MYFFGKCTLLWHFRCSILKRANWLNPKKSDWMRALITILPHLHRESFQSQEQSIFWGLKSKRTWLISHEFPLAGKQSGVADQARSCAARDSIQVTVMGNFDFFDLLGGLSIPTRAQVLLPSVTCTVSNLFKSVELRALYWFNHYFSVTIKSIHGLVLQAV